MHRLRDETGQWLLAAAALVAAVLLVLLTATFTLEQALLSRLAAEDALTTGLRAAVRSLNPADWVAGPMPQPAAQQFQASLAASGYPPEAFAVYTPGQRDERTGFVFPAAGVGGCTNYTIPLFGATFSICADEVTHASP
jgi:hypothetical protein